MRGAIYVEGSQNSKLNGNKKIDATYASIKGTCSPTCPLKDGLCYAKSSFVGIVNARMNRRARQDSPLDIARSEARAIDESHGGGLIPEGRDCRLHVSGDSRSIKGTRVLAKAAARWLTRQGRAMYTYTHSWEHVPRAAWGAINVLASIESVDQVEAAKKQGYACALVVAEHKDDKAYKIKGSNVSWIPCPAQTKANVHCSDCRLCMRSDWLLETNRGILFAAHGLRKNDLKRHLNVIK